jgi:hypothetical protein
VTEDEVPRERFSDDEFAFLRHARFADLPRTVPPDERVELTETEARRNLPDPAPWEWVG